MKIVNVEVNHPQDCPFRIIDGYSSSDKYVCKKLSHDNWIFKCYSPYEFPDEYPLSEFGYLTSDAGLKAAVNTLKKYCDERLDSRYRCDDNCPIHSVCKNKISNLEDVKT